LATLGESEERKEKAATGGLFFGYFLLAAQKTNSPGANLVSFS
jgi:hypothetical protein